ncbi:MAG: LamG domain-containing protein [Candidatus Poribacteria bacterium]|jgi:hypothetical protein|nr:LamG domain-containing protein [Candidatus Poribacteria bacterium]MDP6999167.1 LamG domain-containing protein [Candidatus Poribacteria bacterium]
MNKQYLVRNCGLNLVLVILAIWFVSPLEAQISKKGLMIHYSFEKSTIKGKDIKDLSGNKNDGLIKGKQKTVKGRVGDGMEFAGAAPDYIAVRKRHYAKADIEEITLVAWVKAPSRGMIASWDRSEFFRFGVGDDLLGNLDYIAFDTCCGIHDWHGKTKVTDDKWHHAVISFDGKNKRIYIDGKLDAEVKSPHKVMGKAITRYGYIGIGSEAGAFDAATGPNWAFKGIMDEFFLYHRALTAKEVVHLATGPANPFTVGAKAKLAVSWAQIKDEQ